MTKKDLIKRLDEYDDDTIVLLDEGSLRRNLFTYDVWINISPNGSLGIDHDAELPDSVKAIVLAA